MCECERLISSFDHAFLMGGEKILSVYPFFINVRLGLIAFIKLHATNIIPLAPTSMEANMFGMK